jgi:hypothetical protein
MARCLTFLFFNVFFSVLVQSTGHQKKAKKENKGHAQFEDRFL